MPRLTRRQRELRNWDRYVAAGQAQWVCAKACGAGVAGGTPTKCWMCGSPVVPAKPKQRAAESAKERR